MDNIIIMAVLVLMIGFGIKSSIKHFKGQGGCCGGGSTYVSKKKLKNIIAKKTVIVEGMSCENCKARVERIINDMDGAVGKVNLKNKELIVSMEQEISDENIKAAIEKAGYEVVEIR